MLARYSLLSYDRKQIIAARFRYELAGGYVEHLEYPSGSL
jgi:hypothetical protein